VLSGPSPSIYNFQWLLNNSPIPGAISPLYVAKTSGVYSVVCSLGGCFDTTQTVLITVHPTPPTPSISIILGDSLWSSALYGNQWHDSAGIISGATNQSYKPTHYGNYYVIVTNSNGCASDTSNIIDYGVGISENAFYNDRIKIFPNPNDGNFSIIFDQNNCIEIRIYNINGKQILSKNINKNNSLKINNQKFNAGVYYVKAKFQDKIIVEKVVVY